uniref:IS3 family transposase n=1 Tax=Paenibacillus sp. FSL K6-1318 TaxID=2975291 RepID=UPI00403F027E
MSESEYILFYNQNRFQKRINGRSPVEYRERPQLNHCLQYRGFTAVYVNGSSCYVGGCS